MGVAMLSLLGRHLRSKQINDNESRQNIDRSVGRGGGEAGKHVV